MTFAEFAKLGTEQQMDAIWEWGFYVGKSGGEQFNTVLYAINGYFAEVQMDKTNNLVISILPHHLLSADLLKRYALNQSNPFVRAKTEI